MNSTCDAVTPTGELKPYPAMKDSGVEWLGEVPAHWEVRRLRYLIEGKLVYGANAAAEFTDPNWPRYLRITDFSQNGRLRADTFRSLPPELAKDYLVKPGDVLFARSGATVGKVFLVENEAGAICHAGYLIRARPNRSLLRPAFFFAFAQSPSFARWKDETLIIATIQNIGADKYADLPVPVPPPCEQAAIVRFLDHADQRIGRYIRAKQKQIALLEEQKQTIIHQAVTGKIDLRTGQPYTAYKPSGVEWLGQIPEHWQIQRSKRVFKPRKELARQGDVQLSATQAYGVITQEDYEKRVGRKVVRILQHLEKRRHVELDDFVISMRSFQGGLERAWATGCIRSSYIVLHPTRQLAVEYFSYLFKSAGYISALQLTADFIRDGQDLNFDNFCQVDLPFPPMAEQQLIGKTLDRIITDITSAISESRQQIGLFGEYRTRLIADVVTGKLDIRKAATALPQVNRGELHS